MCLFNRIVCIVFVLIIVSCGSKSEDKTEVNSENSIVLNTYDKPLYGEEIAKMSNGELVILNPNKLREEFKELSKFQEFKPNFSHQFKIVKGDVSNSSFESYLLVLTSVDLTFTAAIEVAKKGESYYKLKGNQKLGSCIGCVKGCDPLLQNGDFICTDCIENDAECLKSVVIMDKQS